MIFLAPYFAPINSIAAIRSTKLVKHFIESGLEVTVLSLKVQDELTDSLLKSDLIYIPSLLTYKPQTMIAKLRVSKRLAGNKADIAFRTYSKNKLVFALRDVLNNLSQAIEVVLEIIISKNLIKTVNENVDLNEVDYLFSTYSPMHSHFAAKIIKRKFQNIKWIADFRDPVFQVTTAFALRSFSKNFVKKTCKNADGILYVAEGMIGNLQIPSNKKKLLVNNGYDLSDLAFLGDKVVNDEFVILLAGSYPENSTIVPLLKILDSMILEGIIDSNKLKLQYVGDNSKRIENEMLEFCPGISLETRNRIEREKIFSEFYANSSMNLILSFETSDSKGILTGKLYELIMLQSPILAIINSVPSKNELFRLIEKTGLGEVLFAQNESHDNLSNVRQFIHKTYIHATSSDGEKKSNSKIINPDLNFIAKFNYKNLAQNVLDFYEKI